MIISPSDNEKPGTAILYQQGMGLPALVVFLSPMLNGEPFPADKAINVKRDEIQLIVGPSDIISFSGEVESRFPANVGVGIVHSDPGNGLFLESPDRSWQRINAAFLNGPYPADWLFMIPQPGEHSLKSGWTGKELSNGGELTVSMHVETQDGEFGRFIDRALYKITVV